MEKVPKLPVPNLTGSLSIPTFTSDNKTATAKDPDGYPSLFDMAAPHQQLHPWYVYKYGIHTPLFQHKSCLPSSLHLPIACGVGVVGHTHRNWHGLAIVKKNFHEFFTNGQSTKISQHMVQTLWRVWHHLAKVLIQE